MTVAELIEVLQQLENPEEKKILIDDTAAGFRDIEYIDASLGYNYVIYTKKPKKRK